MEAKPHPHTRLLHPADLVAAFALLTRLPVPAWPESHARGARAAWAWPLVGALVGTCAGGVGWVASLVLAPAVAAGLALGTAILLTGGLHEDGLADTADGLGGGSSVARRLEIMRDSRIGSYGVLALILVIGLCWTALSQAPPNAFVPILASAGALSRAAMAVAMHHLPAARPGGLSAHTGRPSRATCLVGLALAIALTILLHGAPGLLGIVCAAAATALAMHRAHRLLGGQTGDILGATQQLAALAALLALA